MSDRPFPLYILCNSKQRLVKNSDWNLSRVEKTQSPVSEHPCHVSPLRGWKPFHRIEAVMHISMEGPLQEFVAKHDKLPKQVHLCW